MNYDSHQISFSVRLSLIPTALLAVAIVASALMLSARAELRPYAARVMQLLRDGNHSLFHVTGHSGNVGNEAVDLFLNETLDKFQGKPTKRSKHG